MNPQWLGNEEISVAKPSAKFVERAFVFPEHHSVEGRRDEDVLIGHGLNSIDANEFAHEFRFVNFFGNFLVVAVVAVHDFRGPDAEFDKGHPAILASRVGDFRAQTARSYQLRMNESHPGHKRSVR